MRAVEKGHCSASSLTATGLSDDASSFGFLLPDEFYFCTTASSYTFNKKGQWYLFSISGQRKEEIDCRGDV
jgi:hypothetical protein